MVAFPPIDEDLESPDRRAIFTGAGDSALVDKLIDEIWTEIGSADASVDAIASAIERRIIALYAEYRQLYHPGYMPTAEITYGVWCAGNSSLFHAHGPIVNKIGRGTYSMPPFRSHIAGYKASGIGSDITDYIHEKMKADPHHVDAAVVLATYMLEQAVAHGEGCGGDIRIAWMRNDGTAANVNIDRYTTLILKELDHQISKLVLEAANPKRTDRYMDMMWKFAKGKIEKLRTEQRDALEKEREEREEREAFERYIDEQVAHEQED